MRERVTLSVNGNLVSVPPGTLVAAAVAQAGVSSFHTSVRHEPRGPLCGMGVCFECSVTINGQAYCRSCLTLCEEGMEVQTDG
jgi:predicted molibdopterin-dependent oxidoreductase YjgC